MGYIGVVNPGSSSRIHSFPKGNVPIQIGVYVLFGDNGKYLIVELCYYVGFCRDGELVDLVIGVGVMGWSVQHLAECS